MLKWTTAGESHGQALIALVENMVAGVTVTREEVSNQLARRRLGYGRGARMKFEQDVVTFLTGMRHGKTLGSPITILIDNTEWPKWETIMSADPISLDNPDVAAEMDSGRGARLTRPRPGHADLSGMLKYGHSEARPVLERASARETAARVAAGTVAREFLRQVAGIEILSHVVSIGQSAPYSGPSPEIDDLSAIDDSPVRAFSPEAEQDMIGRIEAAKKSGDTLGGVFEVIATNVQIGLGSFTSAQGRLDAKIAAALMSIQAIKGVEIGDGFEESHRPGSEAHDEIYVQEQGFSRSTNRAGGLEGGMSNGESIRVHAAMKPISTVPRALSTVNMDSGESATAIHQRSDVCAVPAAAIVGESMLALTLAEVFLEKFGGDSLPETASNYRNYCATITQRLQWDQEH